MLDKLDPVAAAIAIATLIFGPAMAGFIGPYSVIVIAATVGAAWSLRRIEKTNAIEVVSYFSLIVFTAILVTVAATNALATWLNIAEPMWLLSLVALVIGGVGGDWPRVARWLFLWAVRMFERRTGMKND